MVQRYDDEFKREVVRVAQTSGFTHKHVAEDFGIGFSTLGKWLVQYGSQAVLSDVNFDAYDELKRLRKENKTLKDERDILNLEGSENDLGDHFPRTRLLPSSRVKSHEVRLHCELPWRAESGEFMPIV